MRGAILNPGSSGSSIPSASFNQPPSLCQAHPGGPLGPWDGQSLIITIIVDNKSTRLSLTLPFQLCRA